MAFTHHGWEIPNSPNFGPTPSWRNFCGGPDECIECRLDAKAFEIRGYLPRDCLAESFVVVNKFIQAVVDAWVNSGVTPMSFHEAKQSHLLVDWPELGQAIKTLAEQFTLRKVS